MTLSSILVQSLFVVMASGEGSSSNRAPFFKGDNYGFWKIRMETYISSLGMDVWDAVKNGYTTPVVPPTDAAGKKEFLDDAKAKNALMCGLVDSELVKVMG